MKADPKEILLHAGNYIKDHPEELVRAFKGLFGLRFGVPVEALRYLVSQLGGSKKAPKDVVIDVAPPGIYLEATVEIMSNPLRIKATAYVDEIYTNADELRLVLRIADLSIKPLLENSPIAGFLSSMDLKKPGNLVGFLPKKPVALVDAKDDRITLDLMKIPSLANNEVLRRGLKIVTPVLGVEAIRTRDSHLDVHFGAKLSGITTSLGEIRNNLPF